MLLALFNYVNSKTQNPQAEYQWRSQLGHQEFYIKLWEVCAKKEKQSVLYCLFLK